MYGRCLEVEIREVIVFVEFWAGLRWIGGWKDTHTHAYTHTDAQVHTGMSYIRFSTSNLLSLSLSLSFSVSLSSIFLPLLLSLLFYLPPFHFALSTLR